MARPKGVTKKHKPRSVERKVKKAKLKAIKQKQTRIEILQTISKLTGFSKKATESFFDALNHVLEGHLMPRGSGEITLPGVGIKIKRLRKKATKARTMFSPLAGREVKVAGKPARYVVKLQALKVLKEKMEKAKE